MPNSRLVTRDHNQGHEYLITTSVAQQSGPRDSVPTDPDSEFIEGAYAEDELQSLDFDDAAGSQIGSSGFPVGDVVLHRCKRETSTNRSSVCRNPGV